jgi:hypothetical protein
MSHYKTQNKNDESQVCAKTLIPREMATLTLNISMHFGIETIKLD